MTGLPAFIDLTKTNKAFPKAIRSAEALSRNLTAGHANIQVGLVASVITTEFVTLTVTVFVKKAFRPALGGALSPFLKIIFRP